MSATIRKPAAKAEHVDVLIVGAGISGVGAAAKAVADSDRVPAAKAHMLHRCFIVVFS